MHENIKSYLQNDRLFIAALLVTVGVVSFWLGHQSVPPITSQNAGVVVELGAFAPVGAMDTAVVPDSAHLPAVLPTAAVAGVTSRMDGDYIASKSGTRYHHISCPGAKQIKEENKLFFATPAEAEAAGYTRAANCSR